MLRPADTDVSTNRIRLAAALLLLAAPAAAEPVGPDAFEALSEGRTLYFRDQAGQQGAEQYFANRRVRWMYTDGQCTDGFWYDVGDAICFVYHIDPMPQCWRLRRDAGTLRATRVELPDSFGLVVERIDDRPLPCAGPDMGV